LPWLLLALFSNYDSTWMDESGMDGSVCINNFWRKNVDPRNMDSKGVGIALVILGVASCLGLITIYDTMMGMNKDMQTQTQGGNNMVMPQDKIENKNAAGLSHENNATTNKVPTMSPGMGM